MMNEKKEVEQEIFFQETQFDPDLGGTDPIAYEKGRLSDRKENKSILRGVNRVKKARLDKAKKALIGHKNKDEIMKILRAGR